MINVNTLSLDAISSSNIRYAILSHTWGNAEVTYQRWGTKMVEGWDGNSKILGACQRAQADGLHYIWVDTCCIDKSNNTELGKAINSMYRWYRNAEVCYAYLSDVSRWFTRGWTLQELLAPRQVKFYDSQWKAIGNLADLSQTIAGITTIHEDALAQKRPLSSYSAAQKFSWAASRHTKEDEDRAYSLIGLCDVSLQLNYGEREEAFIKLQRELLLRGDQSVLAWNVSTGQTTRDLFATSPAAFAESGSVSRDANLNYSDLWFSSNGLKGESALFAPLTREGKYDQEVLLLNCRHEETHNSLIGLPVEACAGNSLGRSAHLYSVSWPSLSPDDFTTHSNRYCVIPGNLRGRVRRVEITLRVKG
ncbi:HET-domain-containing protein [Polychaeton citri CBS 116435]|uniref:HET-domain-containing protein n=1 Tax=Polychaeton citri CBS 116435 TaxID=1314669 RepID=A0A9P4US49_9PEZI|nr:HET-domain-containing protein [Polychaeton citri CBS 116435]